MPDHLYRPYYVDRHGERQQSNIWWIAISHRGKLIRVSTKTSNLAAAKRVLGKKLADLSRGRSIGNEVDRTTFEDLAAIITNDYKANGRRSTDKLSGKLGNLRAFFGMDLARDITTDRITAYIAWRKSDGKRGAGLADGQGHRLSFGNREHPVTDRKRLSRTVAKNATINRDLAALKRAFKLAHEAGRVQNVPAIHMLRESNARKGFFEREQLDALLRHLPQHLKPVVQTAYITGWRIMSEIVTRQRRHLDLDAGWLRLEPGETKNGEGRMFPLTPELREVLSEQVERTREHEKRTGRIVAYLFHRNGMPVGNFRRAWLSACRAAAIPGRLRHDFRRTAVRNLERAGVSRSAAMAMVGHRTQSIYQRYAIADETALREAAEKLSAFSVSNTKGKRSCK